MGMRCWVGRALTAGLWVTLGTQSWTQSRDPSPGVLQQLHALECRDTAAVTHSEK